MNKPIEDFYQWIRSKWFQKRALTFSFIFTFIIMLLSFRLTAIYDVLFWLVYVLINTIIFITWINNRRKFKRSKGKIGIVIGLKTQNSEQHSKIKYDLLDKLKRDLDKDIYQIIELPFSWVSELSNGNSMRRCLQDTNSHILLLCQSWEGKKNGKEKYKLEIDCMVMHFSIDDEKKNLLQNDLDELTYNFEIDKDDDLMNFNLTSNWLSVYTEYFIGLAAFVSGDVYTSVEVFEDLLTKIRLHKNSIKPIKAIRMKIYETLSYSYETLTLDAYEKYWKTKSPTYLDKIKELNDKMYKYGNNIYPYCLMFSIYVFLKYRDIPKARQILSKVENVNDASHWYSKAFLFAYEGQVNRAKNCYEKAQKLPHENTEVLFQIEEFIEFILDIEKDKYHLYLSLSYINLYKGDYVLASQDLVNFLNAATNVDKERFSSVIGDLGNIINNKVDVSKVG